jgi:excisionase family DNA binding protein
VNHPHVKETAVALSEPTELPELLTIAEVAELLSLGMTKVKLLGSGELPSVRIGGAHRITVGQLTEYVRRLERDANGRT